MRGCRSILVKRQGQARSVWTSRSLQACGFYGYREQATTCVRLDFCEVDRRSGAHSLASWSFALVDCSRESCFFRSVTPSSCLKVPLRSANSCTSLFSCSYFAMLACARCSRPLSLLCYVNCLLLPLPTCWHCPCRCFAGVSFQSVLCPFANGRWRAVPPLLLGPPRAAQRWQCSRHGMLAPGEGSCGPALGVILLQFACWGR